MAANPWKRWSRDERAEALENVAAALTEAEEHLIVLAQTETHLPLQRLRAELKRTTFQIGMFADVLGEGAYLDVQIDQADPQWPMGAPRPDLRRHLQPLGMTLVFAASNFPFVFSVALGDSISALAAGCPVVVKVHPGHPRLSAAVAFTVIEALRGSGAPAGVFATIEGAEPVRQALADPRSSGILHGVHQGRAGSAPWRRRTKTGRIYQTDPGSSPGFRKIPAGQSPIHLEGPPPAGAKD